MAVGAVIAAVVAAAASVYGAEKQASAAKKAGAARANAAQLEGGGSAGQYTPTATRLEQGAGKGQGIDSMNMSDFASKFGGQMGSSPSDEARLSQVQAQAPVTAPPPPQADNAPPQQGPGQNGGPTNQPDTTAKDVGTYAGIAQSLMSLYQSAKPQPAPNAGIPQAQPLNYSPTAYMQLAQMAQRRY